jgi:hypothetical protein
MVCEEAVDGSGDLELEPYQAKDSVGDADTATRGFMDIPNVGTGPPDGRSAHRPVHAGG